MQEVRRISKKVPVEWPVKGERAGRDVFDSSILETLMIRAWQDRIAEQRRREIARVRGEPDVDGPEMPDAG